MASVSIGDAGTSHDLFNVPGIVLEYVEGYELEFIDYHAPRETWFKFLQDATHALRDMLAKGVCHGDTHAANCKARHNLTTGALEPVFIDLGHSFVSDGDEDYYWKARAAYEDIEAVIIGYMAQDLGFSYEHFKRSTLSERLIVDFGAAWSEYEDLMFIHQACGCCECDQEDRCPRFDCMWAKRLEALHSSFSEHRATGCPHCTPSWPGSSHQCEWIDIWWKEYTGAESPSQMEWEMREDIQKAKKKQGKSCNLDLTLTPELKARAEQLVNRHVLGLRS